MAFGQLSLKGRALRYLSQREHSRAELTRKLRPYVQDQGEPGAVEQFSQMLDELAAKGLLSDERTAQAVLNLRAQRYGERRLRQELQAKGLAPELVHQTLQQARGSELERARLVWQRKFGQAPADTAAAARQLRFLASRGFGGEVIGVVMKEARGAGGGPADAATAGIDEAMNSDPDSSTDGSTDGSTDDGRHPA